MTPMAGNGFSRQSLSDYAGSERARFEQTLRELVEIPTVSNDPAHREDCRRGADYAATLIRGMGGQARVIPTAGHPMVHGTFQKDPSWPTVTLYNHIDVQPAKVEDGWHTEPFAFTMEGDVYRGRGTTDDKGPALTALRGIRYALSHGARVNVNLLWELEEEIGSPHFEGTIRTEREAMKTDSVIVSDTVWVSRQRPACPAGLRGLQGFRLTLETGQTDQHS